MTIHHKYKQLMPSQTTKMNNKYISIELVSIGNEKRKTKSYNKMMKILIQMYCQEDHE